MGRVKQIVGLSTNIIDYNIPIDAKRGYVSKKIVC